MMHGKLAVLIGVMMCLLSAAPVFAQEVFVLVSDGAAFGVAKLNPSGVGTTMVITVAEIEAALLSLIPEAFDLDFNEYFMDPVKRKLYYTVRYSKDDNDHFAAILRSNTDGSDMEFVGATTTFEFGTTPVFTDVNVLPTQTIPAVGNVGLGILLATIVAAGGWIISKRNGVAGVVS